MAEEKEEKNFFKDYAQQLILGVSVALVLGMITFGVTQIGKIDSIERAIRELPTTSEAVKLDTVISRIEESSGSTESRLKTTLLTLKAKGVLSDEEVRAILDR